MANTSITNLPVAIGLDGTEQVPLVQAGTTKRAASALIAQLGLASALPGAIEFVIDGGGGVIQAQTWGYITVPFNATLTAAVMVADTTGSIEVDVWKCTYTDFDPPTTPSSGDSITGASTPTITNAKKYQNDNLSDWETSLTEGDILAFNVPSAASQITRVTISLYLNRVVS